MPIVGLTTQVGISGITVEGFKSLREESSIEIRPLTILAGANSSGKSSIMQPLLLMKQSLEIIYDPGVFCLNGENVGFTHVDQFIYHSPSQSNSQLKVKLALTSSERLELRYKVSGVDDVEIIESTYEFGNDEEGYIATVVSPGLSADKIIEQSPFELESLRKAYEGISKLEYHWEIVRYRSFLNIGLVGTDDKGKMEIIDWGDLAISGFPTNKFMKYIREIIHVPAIRKNERSTQDRAERGPQFSGRFDEHVAGLVNYWYSQNKDDERLKKIAVSLTELGLTAGIGASPSDNAQLELLVGRTLKSYAKNDTVSIADVGFGVSQVLPVLVALLAAEPGQLVYIEQPELHLHPKAQAALAQVLANAANRGVRVVAETHSDLLLLGIQTLVAEGKLPPDKVILHWFERGEDGETKITPTDLSRTGAYEGWPEDFAEVQMNASNAYLDAVEQQRSNSRE